MRDNDVRLPKNQRILKQLPLILVALFAFVWAVIRAHLQSITIDEADTYFWFAARSARYIWYPFPNNHVLNTLLIWIITHAFGTSILTVRAPALLGAILYISISYFLSRSMTDQLHLQLPIFICLVYNPFILDFMSAARGYGMATAFLLAAIAVPVWRRAHPASSLYKCCAVASLALGLSFTANFSFAFVDGAAFLAILGWAVQYRRTESIVRILRFCILPGLFVALAICGYPLAHWPKGELWIGAHSLEEMTRSVVDASLYQLTPRFLAIELFTLLDFLRPLLLPALGILCAALAVVKVFDGSWSREAPGRWLGKFAAALAGITALSVMLHWLAFRFEKQPLPMSRTALFLIPLCTLVAASIAASPARSLISQWLRRGVTATLIALAAYYLFCLRLTYFKEYEFDADVKDVYSVLARLNHTYGVSDVIANGLYINSLNFYRVLSKKETFPEFQYFPTDQLPLGKSIYVLEGSYYRDFIAREKLGVIYRGHLTRIVVAVSPALSKLSAAH